MDETKSRFGASSHDTGTTPFPEGSYDGPVPSPKSGPDRCQTCGSAIKDGRGLRFDRDLELTIECNDPWHNTPALPQIVHAPDCKQPEPLIASHRQCSECGAEVVWGNGQWQHARQAEAGYRQCTRYPYPPDCGFTSGFVAEVRPETPSPSCHVCGLQMVPTDWRCLSCGSTTKPTDPAPVGEAPASTLAFQLLNSLCCAVEESCRYDVFSARMQIVCHEARKFIDAALKPVPDAAAPQKESPASTTPEDWQAIRDTLLTLVDKLNRAVSDAAAPKETPK